MSAATRRTSGTDATTAPPQEPTLTSPTPASNTATPPRHNYSTNPDVSPFASMKRPRRGTAGANSNNNSRSTTPVPTPSSSNDNANLTLSPLHPPRPPSPVVVVKKDDDEEEEAGGTTTQSSTASSSSNSSDASNSSWVGRKVDALFSPVLSFWTTQENETEGMTLAETTSTSAGHHHDPVLPEEEQADAKRQELQAPPELEATVVAVEEEDDTKENEQDNVAVLEDSMELEHESFDGEEEDDDEFNPWLFIHSLPDYPRVQHLVPTPASVGLVGHQSGNFFLPPPSMTHRKTLVLDLDETLVHCTVETGENAAALPTMTRAPEYLLQVQFHGVTYPVAVYLRPHVLDFLKAVSSRFEVVVFTASQRVYANQLLDKMDPDGRYIHHRLFRESCLAVEGNFLKDLNVLGRDLSTTVLVDNSPHAFGYQVDNGIPIASWFADDWHDRELLKLQQWLLRELVAAPDVRVPVRRKFANHVRIAKAAQKAAQKSAAFA